MSLLTGQPTTLQRTGSTTSIQSDVLLSTNSPPIKFLVLSPVALVPFHSAESFSARSRVDALKPLSGGREDAAALAKDLLLREHRRADVLESMVLQSMRRWMGGTRRCVLAVYIVFTGFPFPGACHGNLGGTRRADGADALT